MTASRVYSVSCPGASGPMTIYNTDGTTKSVACQSGTQYFQPGWSGGTEGALPAGASTSVADCTGSPGCTPPANAAPSTLLLLCDCVLALFRWVGDHIANAAGIPCNGCDPVNLSTGDLQDSHTDLSLSDGLGGVALTRYYSTSLGAATSSPPVGPFGTSGTDGYDIYLSGSCAQYQPMYLNLPGAGRIEFDRPADQATCTHNTGLVDWNDQLVATKAAAPWFGSVLSWEGDRADAVLTRPDGTTMMFNAIGEITKIVDRFGNTTSFIYNPRFGTSGPSGPEGYP